MYATQHEINQLVKLHAERDSTVGKLQQLPLPQFLPSFLFILLCKLKNQHSKQSSDDRPATCQSSEQTRQGRSPSWRSLTSSYPSIGRQTLRAQAAKTSNHVLQSSPVGLAREMPISPSTWPKPGHISCCSDSTSQKHHELYFPTVTDRSCHVYYLGVPILPLLGVVGSRERARTVYKGMYYSRFSLGSHYTLIGIF